MMEAQKSNEPPKPPLTRINREGDLSSCPICHSSLNKKYNFLGLRFGKTLGCIQQKCDNYHENEKDDRQS